MLAFTFFTFFSVFVYRRRPCGRCSVFVLRLYDNHLHLSRPRQNFPKILLKKGATDYSRVSHRGSEGGIRILILPVWFRLAQDVDQQKRMRQQVIDQNILVDALGRMRDGLPHEQLVETIAWLFAYPPTVKPGLPEDIARAAKDIATIRGRATTDMKQQIFRSLGRETFREIMDRKHGEDIRVRPDTVYRDFDLHTDSDSERRLMEVFRDKFHLNIVPVESYIPPISEGISHFRIDFMLPCKVLDHIEHGDEPTPVINEKMIIMGELFGTTQRKEGFSQDEALEQYQRRKAEKMSMESHISRLLGDVGAMFLTSFEPAVIARELDRLNVLYDSDMCGAGPFCKVKRLLDKMGVDAQPLKLTPAQTYARAQLVQKRIFDSVYPVAALFRGQPHYREMLDEAHEQHERYLDTREMLLEQLHGAEDPAEASRLRVALADLDRQYSAAENKIIRAMRQAADKLGAESKGVEAMRGLVERVDADPQEYVTPESARELAAESWKTVGSYNEAERISRAKAKLLIDQWRGRKPEPAAPSPAVQEMPYVA